LIATILLIGAGRVLAQEPPPISTQPRVEGPDISSERRGSPLETLESLAGEGKRESSEIETDRDSFTPATSTTPRGRFILEAAYSFIDNRGVKETHSFPEFLLRYGLTERIELRLGWNAEIGGAGSNVSGSTGGEPFAEPGVVEREYNICYGIKVGITDQGRLLPRSAIIVQVFTPTGGSSGVSTATAFLASYAAGWELPNRWRFETAIRYGLDSEHGDRFSDWAPSAVLRIPIGEKLATHIEYFGLATSGKEANTTRHYISPGVHYLVTPDLEVGFRLGWGLNDQSARFFVNTGFGWRF